MGEPTESSPRRTVSLLKEKTTVSLVDEKVEEHGLKPSEVYGLVGSITTIVATGIFLVWAYTPEPWLHYLGITYYANKYWALGVPTFVMVSVVLALSFYIGLNFIATPPPTSFNTIFDEYSREPSSSVRDFSDDDGEHPIEPISDIPITHINKLMFGRRSNSKRVGAQAQIIITMAKDDIQSKCEKGNDMSPSTPQNTNVIEGDFLQQPKDDTYLEREGWDKYQEE